MLAARAYKLSRCRVNVDEVYHDTSVSPSSTEKKFIAVEDCRLTTSKNHDLGYILGLNPS